MPFRVFSQRSVHEKPVPFRDLGRVAGFHLAWCAEFFRPKTSKAPLTISILWAFRLSQPLFLTYSVSVQLTRSGLLKSPFPDMPEMPCLLQTLARSDLCCTLLHDNLRPIQTTQISQGDSQQLARSRLARMLQASWADQASSSSPYDLLWDRMLVVFLRGVKVVFFQIALFFLSQNGYGIGSKHLESQITVYGIESKHLAKSNAK